jgi:hypothetical protein
MQQPSDPGTSTREFGTIRAPAHGSAAAFGSLSILVALCIPAIAAARPAQQPLSSATSAPVQQGAQLVEVVAPTLITGSLLDLPLAPLWQPGDPIREIPRRSYPTPGDVSQVAPTEALDPLLSRQGEAPVRGGNITPGITWFGDSFTGVTPPDTVGDVGEFHYVQMVNGNLGAIYTVYNKASGSPVAGPSFLDGFGSGVCADGLGDPMVLYDHLAQRWLLSEFSAVANALCVYISLGSNPTLPGWYSYVFTTPSFPDYPKLGMGPNAYFVGTNEAGSSALYALERSKILARQPAGMQRMARAGQAGFNFQVLQPADLDGSNPAPTGAPGWFIRHTDDEAHSPGSSNPSSDFLQLFAYHVDWANPANSSLTGPISVPVAEFSSDLCGLSGLSCFAQPFDGPALDPLREVVMHRLQYRNFGPHETLVGNFVVDVDGTDHGGIRWFELRKSGAAPWTLFQEGTYAPDGADRWLGSAAMDGDGNLAVAYNVVDEVNTVLPSLRYTARRKSDPPGTMPEGEATIFSGSAVNLSSRYGDYASMNVDPTDDCTFWFTGQLNVIPTWDTYVTSFRFANCDVNVLFSDGFESGDVSQWSTSNP